MTGLTLYVVVEEGRLVLHWPEIAGSTTLITREALTEMVDGLNAERALADDLADVLSATTGAWDPEWFAQRDAALARYREARKP